jgi:ribonuclease P/MRP protein subunit POP8
MQDAVMDNVVPVKASKGHEIATRTIKTPQFSYIWLELRSDPPNKVELDVLTVRSQLTAAFTQLFGLTGSAILVDILKVESSECWIRLPREDLSPAVAALGGWMGRVDGTTEVSWKVKGSGNFLSSLVGRRDAANLWNS